MNSKILSLLAISFPTGLWAQSQVVYVDMSNLLYYSLPLYALTLASLALFVYKLMRLDKKIYAVYVTSLIGILGGLLLMQQMEEIRDTQLTPQATHKVEPQMDSLSTLVQTQLRARQQERENLNQAAFWMISTPNVLVFILSLVIDVMRRRRKEEFQTEDGAFLRAKRYKD